MRFHKGATNMESEANVFVAEQHEYQNLATTHFGK